MKNKVILPFILLNLVSGISSGVMLFMTSHLLWLGALLTTLPIPFLLLVMTNVFGIARTSSRLPVIQFLSIAGVALMLFAFMTDQVQAVPHFVATAITVLGAMFVQWYVWVYSSYGRQKSNLVSKAKALPELSFQRLDKQTVSSSSFIGTKTLLVFFRANWCPFCMNQLKEVLAQADKLKALGVQVKFISNQGIDLSQQLADKLALPEHFEILQDEDLKAAKVLGIEDIGGTPAGMSAYPEDTVMATVIALDTEGKVSFGDETDNYRVRPHPDTFIPVFE